MRRGVGERMRIFKSEADKAFYKRIFTLVAPIVVQNILRVIEGDPMGTNVHP